MNSIGFTMPFERTTGSLGYLASTTNELDATYNNMKSLALTNWGERPNHYFMGFNLIEFLFAPDDEETQDKIIQRVHTQVTQWLPYVLLNDVSVLQQEDNRIKLTIDFSIKGRQDMRSVLEVAVGG